MEIFLAQNVCCPERLISIPRIGTVVGGSLTVSGTGAFTDQGFDAGSPSGVVPYAGPGNVSFSDFAAPLLVLELFDSHESNWLLRGRICDDFDLLCSGPLSSVGNGSIYRIRSWRPGIPNGSIRAKSVPVMTVPTIWLLRRKLRNDFFQSNQYPSIRFVVFVGSIWYTLRTSRL